MFRKESMDRAEVPALLFLIATIFCCLFCKYSESAADLFGFLLLTQFLAYATAYLAVIKPGRDDVHIWINYCIWALICDVGQVLSYLDA